jgi:hypothetical protein
MNTLVEHMMIYQVFYKKYRNKNCNFRLKLSLYMMQLFIAIRSLTVLPTLYLKIPRGDNRKLMSTYVTQVLGDFWDCVRANTVVFSTSKDLLRLKLEYEARLAM